MAQQKIASNELEFTGGVFPITGGLSVSAGSNTAPAITTTGDTNTGIFFPAADTIAFSEGGVESMRIDSSGNLGIGSIPSSGRTLTIGKGMTGSTVPYGILNAGIVQSDVTSAAYYFSTFAATQNNTFTLPTLTHYFAQQGTFGASSTITNQIGFLANSNLTGATNNFGFYSDIAAATNRWNFYANGTANNYMAGALGIGTTALTDAVVKLGKNITGGSGGGGGGRYDITNPSGDVPGSGTSGQGNNGGFGTTDLGASSTGGGGGGAGGVGGNGSSQVAGNGGIGLLSSISGTPTYYGGGGGGGCVAGFSYTGGTGGAGGGGNGSNGTSAAAAGTVNTGGGGGGGGTSGNAGGRGVVIVRYRYRFAA
jgi:hypothetical protein